ncbi:uncharacterized protein DUF2760 [Melaminivora alkalimesophila]|uniref:Uncharacterized protein DUF2760 n=2 Tax=Melaminivora alkalimesophila TaxID=1165852 RepID=A0A317R9J8_9BURK|nr:DUF2760 domain-containing protein [Melaminivora alkalimesophila]PWW45655.1 uncharacterized protein DUF2760 [Melaminivora alkalimesophila]
MNPNPTPPSFLRRVALAIGSFFAILGDARLAGAVERLRGGEPLAADAPPREVRVEVPVEKIVETRIEVPVERVVEKTIETVSPAAALQLLALLQRQARFVDFVQEDVAGYSDAEIGAAARVVHEGCRKVLAEHFALAPVRSEEEGSRITLPVGFDATAVRVSGNVVGQPPFAGTLAHRGWQAGEVRLPQLTDPQAARIIAQAEVEL